MNQPSQNSITGLSLDISAADTSQLPPQSAIAQSAGGNLVDSILADIQNNTSSVARGSIADNESLVGSALVPPTSTLGVNVPVTLAPPLSDFAAARQTILDIQIPTVERLARNVIAGICRAYEPGVHPSRTASDLHDLQVALDALRKLLHDSGIGALPLDPSSLRVENAASSPTKSDAMNIDQSPSITKYSMDEKIASKRVEEVFARVQRRKEAAAIALNIFTQGRGQGEASQPSSQSGPAASARTGAAGNTVGTPR
ncbi:hypothetical protein DL93DRAFT_1667547 [Clavulina sp. PMI_390]|nr:hypothetical protein DL93DRAFT_1667547 [Clavulina sp. PMI_390]